MSFSFWNHHFTHTAEVSMPAIDVIQYLQAHFGKRRHRFVNATPELGTLQVGRGSLWCSLFVPGPETWCRHTIDVLANDTENGITLVKFNITLKLFGFSIGKNFLLEECRNLGLELQEQSN